MSVRKRRFSEEFKQEALRRVRAGSGNVSAVARDLGISPDTLRYWRECEQKGSGGALVPAPEAGEDLDKEVKRLRRQVESLEKDKEILKKALAIFSEMPR